MYLKKMPSILRCMMGSHLAKVPRVVAKKERLSPSLQVTGKRLGEGGFMMRVQWAFTGIASRFYISNSPASTVSQFNMQLSPKNCSSMNTQVVLGVAELEVKKSALTRLGSSSSNGGSTNNKGSRPKTEDRHFDGRARGQKVCTYYIRKVLLQRRIDRFKGQKSPHTLLGSPSSNGGLTQDRGVSSPKRRIDTRVAASKVDNYHIRKVHSRLEDRLARCDI